MLMSGAVCHIRPRPDRMSNRRSKGTNNRRRRGREGGGADEQRGGRHRRAQEGKVKGKDRTVTTPLLLPKRRPAERRDRAGATNCWIKSTGRGRGVICQDTYRPRRISVSRRFTETGFTPTLALTFVVALDTTRLGRGGGMTPWLCPHGASTRQAGSFGDALWWTWWKICAGCGTDGGTWIGSSSFRQ